jgi:hypothetical protein
MINSFSRPLNSLKFHGLIKILDLVARKEISLLQLPELVSYLHGKKRLFRANLKPHTFEALMGCLPESFGTALQMKSTHFGNGWAETHVLRSKENEEMTDEVIGIISYDSKLMNYAIDKEINGNNSELAELLNYPKCCADAYIYLAALRELWASYYIKFNSETVGFFTANRLASHFTGISLVGELFPCSLNCEKAAEYGLSNLESLNEAGLKNIASQYQTILSKSLSVNKLGTVRFYSESSYLSKDCAKVNFKV